MKKLLWLLMVGCAFAQAPTKLHIAVDYTNPPELPVVASWHAVPGATAYNIYEVNTFAGLTDANCPTTRPATADATVTVPYYDDNPNPGWWMLPTSNTDGRWKKRTWCYWVTAVVNGMESPAAGPKIITVGNGGYVFLGFRAPGTYSAIDKCAGGLALNPPSTNLADYVIELTYQGADKVPHFFQTQTLFERNQLAALWHTPSIATDGSVIPWNGTGTYGFKFTYKPWNKSVVGFWNPRGGAQWNFYTQVNTNMLVDPGQPDNGDQCALGYFATYDLMENVITK